MGAEVKAQTAGLDRMLLAVSRYHTAVNAAENLADRLERTTCISAEAFPQLEEEVKAVRANLHAADSKADNAISLAMSSPSAYGNPSFDERRKAFDHDEDRADDTDDDIETQMLRLSIAPCPPDAVYRTVGPTPVLPKQTGYLGGGYLGGELAETYGRVRSTETPRDRNVPSFQAVDGGDPLGGGIVGGYNLRPWNNSVVIGPFASFDYLQQTINHNFAGGQFLGTTTHWFINAGVKAGVEVAPGFLIYGLAGAAWLNHDLNVNFATAAGSNVTTPGFTAGIGGEYAPASWRLIGHPVSVFAQYQHTWWSTASFNMPASSPAFNYAFRREDDTVRFGVNFYFNAPPAAVPPSYPVKALPAK